MSKRCHQHCFFPFVQTKFNNFKNCVHVCMNHFCMDGWPEKGRQLSTVPPLTNTKLKMESRNWKNLFFGACRSNSPFSFIGISFFFFFFFRSDNRHCVPCELVPLFNNTYCRNDVDHLGHFPFWSFGTDPKANEEKIDEKTFFTEDQ